MMDKENLYYLVEKGTNHRANDSLKNILILEKEAIKKQLGWYERNDPNREWSSMSIRGYEEKFTEKEPEVKKELASTYSMYSTGKHLLGEYNNKVIVLNIEELSVCKVIADIEVIGNIRDYMKYTGQFKKHAETLIEELIESAT